MAYFVSVYCKHDYRVEGYLIETTIDPFRSFLNDQAYREAIENSSSYNSRLCRERRLRMPFLDSQTGIQQFYCDNFITLNTELNNILYYALTYS